MFSHFCFNDTATTEFYPLSLHDALPILGIQANGPRPASHEREIFQRMALQSHAHARCSINWFNNADRKSTRLNSSHSQISYAVFCLKKKKSCSSTSGCS